MRAVSQDDLRTRTTQSSSLVTLRCLLWASALARLCATRFERSALNRPDCLAQMTHISLILGGEASGAELACLIIV